jgi:hypothetical protein
MSRHPLCLMPACLMVHLLGCVTTTTTPPSRRAELAMGDTLSSKCRQIPTPAMCLHMAGEEPVWEGSSGPRPPPRPPVPTQSPPPPARPPPPEIPSRWSGPENPPPVPPLPPPGLDRPLDPFTQVDAAKKDKGKTPKDSPKKDKPSPSKDKRPKDLSHLPAADKHGIIPDVSGFPPGERPCIITGIGGEALGLPGRAGRIRCDYDCGGRPEEKFGWGKAGEAEEICRKLAPTW